MSHLGLKNPNVIIEKPIHPQRVTVWCGFWYRSIIGPFFFENEQIADVTVNDVRYRAMLNEFLCPKIEEDDIDDIWFQQDGATCHTANVTINFLRTVFENRIISRNPDIDWPPWNCDLTLLDYFLGEPLRVSAKLTIQRWLRPWNAKWKLTFMGLKPKQSKIYWKIGLIDWGTIRPALPVRRGGLKWIETLQSTWIPFKDLKSNPMQSIPRDWKEFNCWNGIAWHSAV